MMKKKFLTTKIVLGFSLLAVFISGCTANRVDLAETGMIKLEQDKMSKAYIAWSSAFEKDDGLVITGVLRRRDHVGIPVRTHVDVSVLSPEGIILNEVRSSDVYVSRRVTGRSCMGSERFEVHLPNTEHAS
ncbi:MAG: hypothetical protein GY774_32060 [Planctomycetes bacterium]|nr:hypothetical protein [Planctomycetota bacterium]